MRRLAPLAIVVGLLAAACGGGSAASLGPGPSGSPAPSTSPSPGSPTGAPTRTPSPRPTLAGKPFTFEVWFVRDGKLFVTRRTEPFTVAVGQLALDGLLEGPTAAESASGITSGIPADTTADITALSGGQATVKLDEGFLAGSPAELRRREAQIVYTLTQYSTIDRVRLVDPTSDVVTTWPRGAFDDLLPAIVVEGPVIGSTVSSPVTISGTANVFEATVSIRILDEGGNEIAHTFTTASCGTGCRGDYSVAVDYDVGHDQPGTIEVFESSAKDGSAVNVQQIPVTLSA